jgi:hypothetical protein
MFYTAFHSSDVIGVFIESSKNSCPQLLSCFRGDLSKYILFKNGEDMFSLTDGINISTFKINGVKKPTFITCVSTRIPLLDIDWFNEFMNSFTMPNCEILLFQRINVVFINCAGYLWFADNISFAKTITVDENTGIIRINSKLYMHLGPESGTEGSEWISMDPIKISGRGTYAIHNIAKTMTNNNLSLLFRFITMGQEDYELSKVSVEYKKIEVDNYEKYVESWCEFNKTPGKFTKPAMRDLADD